MQLDKWDPKPQAMTPEGTDITVEIRLLNGQAGFKLAAAMANQDSDRLAEVIATEAVGKIDNLFDSDGKPIRSGRALWRTMAESDVPPWFAEVMVKAISKNTISEDTEKN